MVKNHGILFRLTLLGILILSSNAFAEIKTYDNFANIYQ